MLDRLIRKGRAVMQGFKEEQVQVLGHQVDVRLEQAQHLTAILQFVDPVDASLAEKQVDPATLLLRAWFSQPGSPASDDIVATAPLAVWAHRPVQIAPGRIGKLPAGFVSVPHIGHEIPTMREFVRLIAAQGRDAESQRGNASGRSIRPERISDPSNRNVPAKTPEMESARSSARVFSHSRSAAMLFASNRARSRRSDNSCRTAKERSDTPSEPRAISSSSDWNSARRSCKPIMAAISLARGENHEGSIGSVTGGLEAVSIREAVTTAGRVTTSVGWLVAGTQWLAVISSSSSLASLT